MAGIKTFLILAVAALDLAVVPRGIGADQPMQDAQLGGSPIKQRRQITLAVGKTVGKLKTVVRLDTFHLYAPAGVPRPQLPQEVGRGIGRLLRIGGKKAQTRELVDCGVLEQAKLRVCNTFTRYDLHIHLNALPRTGHLLIRLWFVCLFRLFGRKQPYFTHHAEQAFRATGIAALPQAVPELDHTKRRIPAAHVTDELQLGLRVLVWMAVRASALAGQRGYTSVPTLFPEVDVRPAFVVLPAGARNAIFFCVLH